MQLATFAGDPIATSSAWSDPVAIQGSVITFSGNSSASAGGAYSVVIEYTAIIANGVPDAANSKTITLTDTTPATSVTNGATGCYTFVARVKTVTGSPTFATIHASGKDT